MSYRENARSVDETEVEKERVREKAATRRRLIDRAGTVMILLGMFGSIALMVHTLATRESVPEPCVETAEVVNHSDPQRRCQGGGRLSITPTNVAGEAIFHCACPRAESDAGQ